jgi:hypothetical protein
MNPMPDSEQTSPNDAVVVALEQIARSARLRPDPTPHPPELQKRPFPRRRSRLGRSGLRGLVGLLVALAVGIGAASVLWLQGDAAKQVPTRWEPPSRLISSLAAESPVAAQSGRPAPTAQAPPAGSAPSAAEPPPEQLTQLLRGFLAVVEQEIEELKTGIGQLKTSQEQMVRDNAAIVEQLKATREQLDRLVAKASEQQSRPRTSALSPRSTATSTGKPGPKLSSSQARAQPRGRPE